MLCRGLCRRCYAEHRANGLLDLVAQPPKPKRSPPKLAPGHRIGNWTVVDKGTYRNRLWYYSVRCICGAVIEKREQDMAKHFACRKCVHGANDRNGLSYNPKTKKLYDIWKCARARCFNPKHPKYPRYGGRGITMCQEWRLSFEAFLDHVRPIYREGMLMDRIDNDGNYEPGNLRWVDAKTSLENRECSA